MGVLRWDVAALGWCAEGRQKVNDFRVEIENFANSTATAMNEWAKNKKNESRSRSFTKKIEETYNTQARNKLNLDLKKMITIGGPRKLLGGEEKCTIFLTSLYDFCKMIKENVCHPFCCCCCCCCRAAFPATSSVLFFINIGVSSYRTASPAQQLFFVTARSLFCSQNEIECKFV